MSMLIKILILVLISSTTKGVLPFKKRPILQSNQQRQQETGETSSSTEQTEENQERQQTIQIPMTESGLSMLELFEEFEKKEEEEEGLKIDETEFVVEEGEMTVYEERFNEPKEKEVSPKEAQGKKEKIREETNDFEEGDEGSRTNEREIEVSAWEEDLLKQFEEFEDQSKATTSTTHVTEARVGETVTIEEEIIMETGESSSPTTEEAQSPKKKSSKKRKHLEESDEESTSKKKKEKKKHKKKKKEYKYDSSELKDLRCHKAELLKQRRWVEQKIAFLSRECAIVGNQLLLITENQKGKKSHLKLQDQKSKTINSIRELEVEIEGLNNYIEEDSKEMRKLEGELRRLKEKEKIKIKQENISDSSSDKEEEEIEIINLDSEDEEEFSTGIEWSTGSEQIIPFDKLVKMNYRFPSLSSIVSDICFLKLYLLKIALLNSKYRLKIATTFEKTEKELKKIESLQEKIAEQQLKLYGKEWKSVTRCRTNWKSFFKSGYLGPDSTNEERLEREELIKQLKNAKSITSLYKAVSSESASLIKIHLENLPRFKKRTKKNK